MKLEIITPSKALNKAYFKQNLKQGQIDVFKTNLITLFERVKASGKEHEEHFKNIVVEFLNDTYYKGHYYINTDKRKDLVIHSGKSKSDSVSVIIEAKSPTNKAEMFSREKPNVKAFQELLHYYLEERFINGNKDIKHLIITNVEEWYVFDGSDFERFFFDNKKLTKQYKDWKDGLFGVSKTDWLYEEVAKPFIEKELTQLNCTYFSLKKAHSLIEKKDADEKLVEYYKFLSPEHLLKKPFANDSNSLNKDFYNELLHILGLEEKKDGGKKLIDRKDKDERNDGSLLENTINILKTRNKLKEVENVEQYGATEDEQLYSVGLEICISWLNRILFLKLLEGQLIKYHKGDKSYAFLNSEKIKDYDELNELFFEVLAINIHDRTQTVNEKFGNIPYLNSSLFEENILESKTIVIADIKDRLDLPYHSGTVIKDAAGKKLQGKINTLEYLFKFLDAYDFSSDDKAGIQKDNKTVINASVLGLIFEKINGYKDGSFFTPGYITMYMCRETIRRAVVQKFNDVKDWNCETETDLFNKLDKLSIKEANEIYNSVKICDPAVGSGHFLVSALNEMIAFKSELEILADKDHKRLKGYKIEIENDELIITHEEKFFEYNIKDTESQRVQETLFHEKQSIIEQCLFGVDINPKSVLICRLRLWVELLKNAYYKSTAKGQKEELQTLPNIDINIKCGNSLISRFKTDFKIDDFRNINKRQAFLKLLDNYRVDVLAYKHAKGKTEKDSIRERNKHFRYEISNLFLADQKEWAEIKALESQLGATAFDFEFGTTNAEAFNSKTQTKHDEIAAKKKAFLEKYTNLYGNAFEWRFEFPEILHPETAEFIGFDVVIGNPPYIRQEKLEVISKELYLKQFSDVGTSTADIYVYFFGLGLQITKENSFLSFITLNKWLKTKYGSNLRLKLAPLNVINIIDFFELPVFEEASTDSAITLIQIRISDSDSKYFPIKTLKDLNLFLLEEKHNHLKISKEESEWKFINISDNTLIDKINSDSIPLKEYCNSKMYMGVKTGCNEVFIVDNSTKEKLCLEHPSAKNIIRPYARPTEFTPYEITGEPEWFINSHNGFLVSKEDWEENSVEKDGKEYMPVNGLLIEIHRKEERSKSSLRLNRIDVENDYPSIYNYFLLHKEKLTKRGDQGEHWTNLRNCDYVYQFDEIKIMYVYTAKNHHFYFDTDGMMINNSSYMIVTNSKYLWAYLNSKLFLWFKKLKFVAYGDADEGGRVKLDFNKMETVPIKNVTPEQEAEIEKLANKILSIKSKKQKVDVSKEKTTLDNLIYKLYNLTPEEIAIIEGAE